MAKGTGGELRLRLRIQAEVVAAGQDGKVAKPEKQLNCFVRAVALIERVGNALGTLAFTWQPSSCWVAIIPRCSGSMTTFRSPPP
jgi:hypothetical protein